MMSSRKIKFLRNYINVIQKIKIYLAYFRIKFLNEIQYKLAAFSGILTQFAWGGMLIMLYTSFLNNGSAAKVEITKIG